MTNIYKSRYRGKQFKTNKKIKQYQKREKRNLISTFGIILGFFFVKGFKD